MFRVKICGITTLNDARAAADAGADAIGLNFCPASPRCVHAARAADILAGLPPGMAKVGVFVNLPAAEVCGLADRLGLDWIQLHGDEPPEYLSELGSRRVVRALRVGGQGVQPAADYLAACRRAGGMPEAVLVDAFSAEQYGGTGQCVDWQALASRQDWLAGLPLVLAGGLTPENVGQAIATVRPAAVDTASGVEASPGRKDPLQIARFVAAARAAWS